MDQNVRVPHQATGRNQQATGRSNDSLRSDSARDFETGKPAFGSAMVVVLGLVALVSMAFGFVLGLLI